MTDEPKSELISIRGIGPGRAEQLARLGLFSRSQLLEYLPRGYLDYSKATTIEDAEDGDSVAISIRHIGTPRVFRAKKGITVTTVSIGDETGNLVATWFNQPYISRGVPRVPGGYILGVMDKKHGAKLLRASFVRELPGVIPVYTLTKGLSQSVMRTVMRRALDCSLDTVEETMPASILREYGLVGLREAISEVHFPKDMTALRAARRRLAFEGAAVLTIVLEALRKNRKSEKGIAFDTRGVLDGFLSKLPFTPTEAQFAVMNDISFDMAQPQPMSRLIQGDVGSGKTALALFALFIAEKNGYQGVLMAPTEILAEQHYIWLKRFFGDRAALLTGHMGAREKREALEGLRSGRIAAVTGTHALIEGGVEFCRLGVVITDEQHRFGVRQRAAIGRKGEAPDTIIMSATPIPRTLSLILYGDLDVSLVTGMPPGRKPVVTRLVPNEKRTAMYRYIEKRIKREGTQAYVVCPMIEESEQMGGVRSAEALFDELKENLELRIALVHGRLKSAEKDAVMEEFRAGRIDLIVSTTVIEVGVDVANACTMVIESAERFGLAQLHQLRGRVGRGEKQSECYLLSESTSKSALARLRVLTETNDGFRIAEKDLETRGPGELIGMRQHGISELGAAALAADIETLKLARDCARKLVLSSDPECERMVEKALRKYNDVMDGVVIN